MRGTLHRGRSSEAIDVAREELVDECAAFLSGRWAEWQCGGGHPVPSWAWINEAAHADAARLEVMASRPAPLTPANRDDVGALIARALLAARPGGVSEAQREVLIPLELDLMGAVVSPRRVVELAATALFR